MMEGGNELTFMQLKYCENGHPKIMYDGPYCPFCRHILTRAAQRKAHRQDIRKMERQIEVLENKIKARIHLGIAVPKKY